jgi:proteasome lid subunit RPN8/RPN11
LAAESAIAIPRLIWFGLVGDLRQRGRGRRESGAFLLGSVDGSDRRVLEYVCYDDLDPRALDEGIVVFHGQGFSKLWDLCAKRKLQVLADIHTHPGRGVGQSSIDQENAMVPVAGHVAMIAPHFGYTSRWSLDDVGIHRLEEGGRWKRFRARDKNTPIRLCTW